jgi:hypothetical protein
LVGTSSSKCIALRTSSDSIVSIFRFTRQQILGATTNLHVTMHETATPADEEALQIYCFLVSDLRDLFHLRFVTGTNFHANSVQNKSCPAPAGRQPADSNCSFSSPLMSEVRDQPQPNLQLQNFSYMFCRFKTHPSNKYLNQLHAICGTAACNLGNSCMQSVEQLHAICETATCYL